VTKEDTLFEGSVKDGSLSFGDTPDTDPEGDDLTFSVVMDATHGELTLQSDGDFSYLPSPDYNGPDSFTCTCQQLLLFLPLCPSVPFGLLPAYLLLVENCSTYSNLQTKSLMGKEERLKPLVRSNVEQISW